jgi:uncharacterized protein YbjQ (UPF0145 family)
LRQLPEARAIAGGFPDARRSPDKFHEFSYDWACISLEIECLMAQTMERTRAMEENVSEIKLSNIEYFPGYAITRHLGLVQGSTVRAKHVGRDLMASLKNVVGGELKGYTELLTESRQEATERMVSQARAMGANAVINVRFSTANIAVGAAEILAYGTAVVLERRG